VSELTRRGLVSTSAMGAAVLVAGCGDDSNAPAEGPPRGDLDIVSYALTLEYLEEAFYEEVMGAGVLSGREADLVRLIHQNETDHVAALQDASRRVAPGRPVLDRPRTDFSEVLDGGRGEVIRTAARLENIGAGAYLAEAGQIDDAKLLAAALSIHSVEARHAAVLNRLAGAPPLPDGAFAVALERAQVMSQIDRYLV
jgi:Ferritin-like domain